MSSFVVIGSAILVGLSAIVIALGREIRWSIFAWWVNGLSAASMLLSFGAELLALVLAISTTVCALAFFIHYDAFGVTHARDRAPRVAIKMIFPLLVSMGVGFTAVSLIRAVLTDGAPLSSQAAASALSEESFISIQLLAVLGLAVALGVGVITRPARISNVSESRPTNG